MDRDDLATKYLEQLPYEPYPVQEEAILTWFTTDHGVLVCAPTGTGKTLIAEAALFEALHTGKRAYYTTPLIALTEQKLQELRESAVRWGFSADDVGLVTGNRRINPDAKILVVVAEILFNRLLRPDEFDTENVSAVVMDEFHSFNDPERGIVWEFSLALLPPQIRLMLLSATVGNAYEFTSWMRRSHNRDLELVQGTERKVPLSFHWIGDRLLTEQLEYMADGDDETRYTPTLVFCFNREECWTVAEQLKGKSMLFSGQQKQLAAELEKYDWSKGAGPKLKQILMRGVGVHHAGLLPKYKRIVEDLFQRKLLSVTVCTETLAAGINLPARSVVIPNLLKGPPDKKRLIDASSAHQMFGRAGRPQFDTEGHVFSLPHEDDVKILRWKEKYDQIPEDTKDPKLRAAKKALKKKMPTRRANQQYWTEGQFEKLRDAPAGNLESRGYLPWRLLAYMLDVSPEVDVIRHLISKRLMQGTRLENSQKSLEQMLRVLWTAGYVELEPKPPLEPTSSEGKQHSNASPTEDAATANPPANDAASNGLSLPTGGLFSLGGAAPEPASEPKVDSSKQARSGDSKKQNTSPADDYKAKFARPTERMDLLLKLRGVHPLYGVFVVNQLGIADRNERIQALESILELPNSVGRFVRVPKHEEMPPGPLATSRLDVQLLQLGLASPEELTGKQKDDDDDDRRSRFTEEEPVYVLTLAKKLRRLFDHDFPGVRDLYTSSVWAAGEVLEFGDFNKYVTSKRLQKQEGVIFRHLLRLILLIGEFALLCPPETTPDEWRSDLFDIRDRLVEICRVVDPSSVDSTLEQAEANQAEEGF
ncbi:MAG: DEAD/DEAH box helicase [Pirellulaceae bacterium]